MKKLIIPIGIYIGLFCVGLYTIWAAGSIFYVEKNGSNTSPYDTLAKASTTIQAVFDDGAINGGAGLEPSDIIMVCAATAGGSATYTENIIWGANDDGDATGYVYLKARSGDTITLEAASTNVLVSLQDYTRVEGFIIDGTGGFTNNLISFNGNYNYLYNCTVSNHVGHPGVALQFNGATNATIDSCTFTDNQNDAIFFTGAGDNHTIKDSTFSGNGAGSANDRDTIGSNGCTGIVIEDCTFTFAGAGYVIAGAGGAGITVRRCKINHTGGGIRAISLDPQGTYVVESNFIKTHSTSNGIYAILTDNGNPADFTIYNNTIVNALYGINLATTAVIDAATVAVVKNNCIYGSDTYHIRIPDVAAQAYVDLDYNHYGDDTGTKFRWGGNDYNFADWKTNTGYDGNSPATGDPKFVDAANNDFHLLVSSPCIDAGANLTATVTKDIDGQSTTHANMDGNANGSPTDMDIGADQVKFLSVLTGAATLQYSLLDGEDGNYAGLAISGGQTIDNVTIARCVSGALRVNGNQTIENVALDDECYIVSAVTLTANNCAFQEAEAVIAVDGTITDTDCQFSVSDFGFRNKAIGDFNLEAGSVLLDKGKDTGPGIDLNGRVTPCGTAHEPGAYECSNMKLWNLLWRGVFGASIKPRW